MLQLQCCCSDEDKALGVDPKSFSDAVRGLHIASERLHKVCIKRHHIINAVVDELDRRRTRDSRYTNDVSNALYKSQSNISCCTNRLALLNLI